MYSDIELGDLTLLERDLLLNQCGPKEGIGSWVDAPDLIYGECCDRHDLRYLVGGVRDQPHGDASERYMADLEMYECMQMRAAKKGWWIRWWYLMIARTYFNLVVSWGQDNYIFRTKEELKALEIDDLLREEQERQARTGERRTSAFEKCMKDCGRW